MSKPTIKPGPLADDVKKASERVAEWEGARGDVTLESLAREAAEELKRCAVWEDFDCPGDTPVSCGLWCSLCEQYVNDQQTDHASHCLITLLCS